MKKAEEDKIRIEKEAAIALKETEKLKGRALEEERARQEEEKRKREEEIKRLEAERKNKVAEIVGVEILDKDGKVRNVFETNESLRVKVNYVSPNNLNARINVGVSISSPGGERILGYNTIMDNFVVNAGGRSVNISFPNIPLLKGIYYVNATIFGVENTVVIDFKPKISSFTVFSSGKNNQYNGILSIDHQWS